MCLESYWIRAPGLCHVCVLNIIKKKKVSIHVARACARVWTVRLPPCVLLRIRKLLPEVPFNLMKPWCGDGPEWCGAAGAPLLEKISPWFKKKITLDNGFKTGTKSCGVTSVYRTFSFRVKETKVIKIKTTRWNVCFSFSRPKCTAWASGERPMAMERKSKFCFAQLAGFFFPFLNVELRNDLMREISLVSSKVLSRVTLTSPAFGLRWSWVWFSFV